MDKIDKTKDNIKVTRLDQKTRKELFEKFVDSGGKIVDNKSERRHLVIDRENQKNLKKRLASRSNKRIKKEKPQAKDEETKPAPVSRALPEDEIGSFFYFLGKLKLRFKLKFNGITGFDGYYFSKKFFKKFNSAYKPAMMEIQILFLEIFRRNFPLGRTIIESLDDIKPLYFELAEKAGNLFDKILTDQIIEQYMNYPDVSKKVSDLRDPLLRLMKKIYVLAPYENTIINSFERAIDIYGKSGEPLSDSLSGLKRKMRNDIFVIFHKLYPRLHLLSFQLFGRGLDDHRHVLDDVLSVTDEDRPGKRTLNKYFEEETDEQPAEFEAENKPADRPDAKDSFRAKAVKKGLEIMSKLDMTRLRKEYDKARLFEYVSDVDKVFVTYLLFNEFDREYSCVLTTNKIKFRTDFISRTQADFKAGLIGLYDKMKKSADSLKEYAEELKIYEKARQEKPLSNVQYIEFTKRMEAAEKKKNISGKNALGIVRSYMNEVVQALNILVEDMDHQQLYIENPQDALAFDPLIEGEKKINNMKIFEAIYVVNCYASAFVYRLSTEGDLSGNLEFKKEEIEMIQKQMKDSASPAQPDKEESRQEKSVLEELDDLL